MSGGTYIDEDKLDQVSAQSPDLAKPGCYVFACASPRGSLPVYVGQASRNIFREAFNDRNLKNLNTYLSYRKRGRIELYVIHQNAVRGDTGNKTCIDDIEDFLIGYASLQERQLDQHPRHSDQPMVDQWCCEPHERRAPRQLCPCLQEHDGNGSQAR